MGTASQFNSRSASTEYDKIKYRIVAELFTKMLILVDFSKFLGVNQQTAQQPQAQQSQQPQSQHGQMPMKTGLYSCESNRYTRKHICFYHAKMVVIECLTLYGFYFNFICSLHLQISHRADGRNHHRLHNAAIFQIMMMEHHCGHHLYVFIYRLLSHSFS